MSHLPPRCPPSLFCRLGRDPPGLGSVSHPCRGAQGPGCQSSSPWSPHRLAAFSMQTSVLTPPPAPPLPGPAASLRGLSGPQALRPHGLRFSSPVLRYVSLEFLRAPGYLLAPIGAGAPSPRHDRHSLPRTYHHDVPLRFPQRAPRKGPKRRALRLYLG